MHFPSDSLMPVKTLVSPKSTVNQNPAPLRAISVLVLPSIKLLPVPSTPSSSLITQLARLLISWLLLGVPLFRLQ